jgi:glycerol-3-phosphate acyltransferase PlsY
LKDLFLLGAAAYLVASINFSIILFRLFGKGDPRDKFSGNAGATNVARQLGKPWALVVLLLEIGRAGAVAVAGVRLLPAALLPLLGLILIVGNQKPLFHRFRGGKGVAAYLGFTFFIEPIVAGLSCLAWVLAYGWFRQPFMASFFMVAVLALGTICSFSSAWPAVIGAGASMGLIFRAHKENMAPNRKKGAWRKP